MGLLDKIKSAFSTGSGDGQAPVSATFATRDDVVYAPVSGVLVSLKEVNDEVLSAGLLGDGYGIVPVGNGVLYSPVNGRIGATTVTNPIEDINAFESRLKLGSTFSFGSINPY